VFAIYTSARMVRGKSAVRWWQAAAVSAAVALALVPVAFRAVDLFRHAGSHVIVAPPTLRDLANSLKYGLLLVCGMGAWLARRIAFRLPRVPESPTESPRVLGPGPDATGSEPNRSWSQSAPHKETDRAAAHPPSDSWLLNPCDSLVILSWWLVQPLCLFAVSLFTGSSVFVSRYYSLALAGTALAATLWASRSLTVEAWKPAAAVLGVGALLMAGQWNRLWPLHQKSDWRGAAQQVRQLAIDPATPVICPSPFVEARPPAWNPDYRLPGFLYAHLAVYPLPGRILLFPFDDSPQAESYAAQLAATTLAPSGRFVIFGGAGQAGFWWKWLAGRSELAGWTSRRTGDFGDVTVVLFSRSHIGR
jgi:hypothetical protein